VRRELAGIRAFLTAVFQDAGYDVREAANGLDALHALRAWHPDIVLLENGHVRLLEEIHRPAARRALLTVLDETPTHSEPAQSEITPAAKQPPRSDGGPASVAAIRQSWGTVELDEKALRWVAEDKLLEYGAEPEVYAPVDL
jgi:hypothetical protein